MTATYAIAYAIPGFLLLVAVEALVARAMGRRVFRLRATLSDLGTGMAQQVVLVFAWGWLLSGYDRITAALPHSLPVRSPVTWVVAFVAVDLAHYVAHRASHEVAFLWAVHAVHHQSEQYNLAAALRQAALSAFTTTPFLYPLALLGLPSEVVAAQVTAAAVYQFFLHTRLVGRLGPAEALFATPSHHRVHHAVNPGYLDRNYGAILIVWDRLFGTFAEEREPAVYGTTKPIGSFNPLWAQAHEWVAIARRARDLRGLDRVAIWFRSPSWSPAAPGANASPRRTRPLAALSRSQKAYAATQFAPLVPALMWLLFQGGLPARALAPTAALILWALLSLGGLLDGRRWPSPSSWPGRSASSQGPSPFPSPGGLRWWRAPAPWLPRPGWRACTWRPRGWTLPLAWRGSLACSPALRGLLLAGGLERGGGTDAPRTRRRRDPRVGGGRWRCSTSCGGLRALGPLGRGCARRGSSARQLEAGKQR